MKMIYQALAAVLAGLAMAVVSVCVQRQAHAAEAWRSPDQAQALVLSQEPCTDDRVISRLRAGEVKPEFIAQYKAATLTWGGRTWASCWIELELVDQGGREHRSIYSVDQEGDVFNPPYGIPRRLFRDDAI